MSFHKLTSSESPSQTTSTPEPPISTKLGTEHPWVKGIRSLSYGGPCPFIKGILIATNLKYWKLWKSSKEPVGQFQLNMTQSILG